MRIAILFYQGMTPLDAIGPYQVLSAIPGAEMLFVSEDGGLVRADSGPLALKAQYRFDEVSSADILVIPGGPGDDTACANQALVDWVKKIDATTTWTTSVCTGSLILGAAGLLRGIRATTHWLRMDKLREFGAEPTGERVVEVGKIITAAGVSSGIDMALRLVQKLAGDDLAQGIQLAIEYDPQPPFDAGSPAKAPAHVVSLVKMAMTQMMAEYPG